MVKNRYAFWLLGALLSAGCSSASPSATGEEPEVEPGTPAEGADQIAPSDDPKRLFAGASFKLSDNISKSDIGKTFGVADTNVPYPDTYWPFTEEGADAHWNGSSSQSPIEKFMAVFDAANVKKAKDWEHSNHGSGVPGVASWWGHCPGWTGAALTNKPIKHAVSVKRGGATCTAGSAGCITFEIGDINALMAEIYVDGRSSFIGARCDTKPSEIKRDQNGRIERNGGGCQGLNAGSLLVLLGNMMKKRKLGFAIDAQNDFNTDQIWNQPAYSYKVYRYETLTEAQAANLVAHGTRTGDKTKYEWNAKAKGFVFVDVGLNWVSERGPNTTMVSGKDSTRETRMVSVVELDAAPNSAAAKIIGGEYLEDSSVDATRLKVPPFVWASIGPGPERGGNGHNPWIRPSLVRKLIAFGQR